MSELTVHPDWDAQAVARLADQHQASVAILSARADWLIEQSMRDDLPAGLSTWLTRHAKETRAGLAVVQNQAVTFRELVCRPRQTRP